MQYNSDDPDNDTPLGTGPHTLAEAESGSNIVPDAVKFIRREKGSGAGGSQSNRQDEPLSATEMDAIVAQEENAVKRGLGKVRLGLAGLIGGDAAKEKALLNRDRSSAIKRGGRQPEVGEFREGWRVQIAGSEHHARTAGHAADSVSETKDLGEQIKELAQRTPSQEQIHALVEHLGEVSGPRGPYTSAELKHFMDACIIGGPALQTDVPETYGLQKIALSRYQLNGISSNHAVVAGHMAEPLTRDELLGLVGNLSRVEGSSDTFSSTQLRDIITSVLNDENPMEKINFVTGACGLRALTAGVVQREQAEGRPHSPNGGNHQVAE